MLAQLAGTSMVRTSFYRRKQCKAPRKRTFLAQVSCRSPRSEGAPGAVVGGGNGPKGPRDPNICHWGNDSGGNGGDSSMVTKHGLLACVAAVGVAASVTMPSAATAAGVDSVRMSAQVASYDSIEHDEFFCTSSFLTEEEKGVMAPKQYRVREWVYVH